MKTNKKLFPLVLNAILFAIIIILNIIESLIPPFLPLIPGIKLGLSNVVIMFCIFFLNKESSFVLIFLKSTFVFLTRGIMAAFLSLFGGFFSLLIMLILIMIMKKPTYIFISIFGAIFHNIGQFIAISIIYKSAIYSYLPFLIVCGTMFGVITGIALNLLMPSLKNLQRL